MRMFLKRSALAAVIGALVAAMTPAVKAEEPASPSIPGWPFSGEMRVGIPENLDLNVLTPAGEVRIAGGPGGMSQQMSLNMASPWLDYALKASGLSGLNGMPAAAAPASSPAYRNPAPAAKRPIRIMNPAETGVTLTFLVDGKVYRLAPGKYQDLVIGQRSIVQFDRGGGLGMASYVMTDGAYRFDASSNGWMLNRVAAE